jgi:hypothetical protein
MLKTIVIVVLCLCILVLAGGFRFTSSSKDTEISIKNTEIQKLKVSVNNKGNALLTCENGPEKNWYKIDDFKENYDIPDQMYYELQKQVNNMIDSRRRGLKRNFKDKTKDEIKKLAQKELIDPIDKAFSDKKPVDTDIVVKDDKFYYKSDGKDVELQWHKTPSQIIKDNGEQEKRDKEREKQKKRDKERGKSGDINIAAASQMFRHEQTHHWKEAGLIITKNSIPIKIKIGYSREVEGMKAGIKEFIKVIDIGKCFIDQVKKHKNDPVFTDFIAEVSHKIVNDDSYKLNDDDMKLVKNVIEKVVYEPVCVPPILLYVNAMNKIQRKQIKVKPLYCQLQRNQLQMVLKGLVTLRMIKSIGSGSKFINKLLEISQNVCTCK